MIKIFFIFIICQLLINCFFGGFTFLILVRFRFNLFYIFLSLRINFRSCICNRFIILNSFHFSLNFLSKRIDFRNSVECKGWRRKFNIRVFLCFNFLFAELLQILLILVSNWICNLLLNQLVFVVESLHIFMQSNVGLGICDIEWD